MGEIMCQQCVALGVAGVVIDGAVRDSVAIRELGLPDVRRRHSTRTGRPSSSPGRLEPSDLDRRRHA